MNQKEFIHLINPFKDKIFRLAKRLLVSTEEAEDATQEVLNGNADAMVYDRPYNAIFYAEKGKDKLVHLSDELTYEPLGFAIRKGDPDFINWLNNFLNQTKHDGTYQKIYDRWFSDASWQKKVM